MKRTTTIKPERWWVIIGFLLAAAQSLLAADVKIVANASVKTDVISADELKSVYLLQRRTLKDGSSVEPVLQRSGAIHDAFLQQYLSRGSEEIHAYYLGLAFTGKGSLPKEVRSDAEVLAYVVKTRGAIGYVSPSASTEGVKVLEVIGEEKKSDRTLLVHVEPEYPETLQQLHIGGTVRLAVTISSKGSVEKVALVGGNPILGDAAITAVRKWVYSAAPSQTTTEITIPFNPKP